ncbi:MAG: hypothetical protein KDK36_14330, partial [Leptospiraceae bacterium]|nr:hypothetical protein [Leptospiraceae bacterium]
IQKICILYKGIEVAMKKKLIFPGFSDFKNKYGKKYKSYNLSILKIIFESLGDIILENRLATLTFPEIIKIIRIELMQEAGLEILKPEPIVTDLIEYFLELNHKWGKGNEREMM